MEEEGVVAKTWPGRQYAFIFGPQREQIYTDSRILGPGLFSKLQPGIAVRYMRRQGDLGPMAVQLEIIDGGGACDPI